MIFPIYSHAYEVDNYTDRYKPLADSLEVLNKEVNFQMQEAIDALNDADSEDQSSLAGKNSCNREFLYGAVGDYLRGGIVGNLEDFANESDKIQKHKSKSSSSIYSKQKIKDKANNIVMTAAGLEPSINLANHYIGVDKLGHFFDEGYSYYRVFVNENKPDATYQSRTISALTFGNGLEAGRYGMQTTGIKSYADLAANYAGFNFWVQLAAGPKPYFQCTKGKWKKVRSFNWAEYVNSAWDEAINCSKFNDGLKVAVETRVKELEAKHKDKKFSCPVVPAECTKLVNYYSQKAQYVLGPDCINAAKNSSNSKTTRTPTINENKQNKGAR